MKSPEIEPTRDPVVGKADVEKMTIEAPFEQQENTEQTALKRLDALGVRYRREGDSAEGAKYVFPNVRGAGGGAFWLDTNGGAKVILQSFHFDKEMNSGLSDENSATLRGPTESFPERFPDANETVYSCCSPDDARTAFQTTHLTPLIIGSGSSEYRTVHNSRKNLITVSPT